MLRQIAAAVPVILMLSLAGTAGVTAQDESPATDAVPAEAAPIDVALLEALCEANAPDDAAMANCLDVVHTILAPALSPADDIDLEALGQAYLLAAEEANAKWLDVSGNERAQLRKLAVIADEFVTEVEALEFPPAIQVAADRVIEANKEIARLSRAVAGLNKKAPDYYELKGRLRVASFEVDETTQEVRRLLGLPVDAEGE